jgi:TrmH family RNA methyltransferase
MLSLKEKKILNLLKQKKYRQKYGFFIAEGDKIVKDFIHSDWEIYDLYLLKEWKENISLKELPDYTKIHIIDYEELKKVSSLKSPHNVLAVIKIPEKNTEYRPNPEKLVLMLDEIKDPGNLGTIIRTANWFGIRDIICSPDSVDVFNPKVIQSSMSALIHVRVWYQDLKTSLEQFNKADIPVYGTFLTGENIYDASVTSGGVILMGNESRGIAADLEPFITHKLTIPPYQQSGKDTIESLNVASATGIICAEFRRRK